MGKDLSAPPLDHHVPLPPMPLHSSRRQRHSTAPATPAISARTNEFHYTNIYKYNLYAPIHTAHKRWRASGLGRLEAGVAESRGDAGDYAAAGISSTSVYVWVPALEDGTQLGEC